jgi:GNAT superfamily N-acetyltransferase
MLATAPVLRLATPDDALCLGVLGLQVFLDTYATGGIRPTVAREVLTAFSTQALRDLIDRPNGWLCVAESNGHLVGFAQMACSVPQPLVQAARPAELERLYVQEPFTRQGVGSALIRRCEQAAAEAGADALWLSPWVHNQRALAFYAHHGYQDLGATWYVFEDERHENRVLVKTVAALAGQGKG